MNKILVIVISVVLLILAFTCAKSVSETEEKLGGSYESCIEMGHEKAMCKRVFEF